MKSGLAYKKITRIEQELRNLKKSLFAQRKVVHLRGLLRRVKITEEEIEEAKKSLFRA